ncbi:MAG: flagellar basal body-associated FliL family protein [Candidatus Puniceispirillales bacterium]|jgi:flagellar basal body-associated protein FliL|nr:flagellar basal body-associated FliL family protein [Pseudomonadota bacterium]
MADQSPSLKSKVMNIKNLYLYIIGFVSSLLTLLFFYFSNQIIKEEKKVEEKVDIYKVAKEEAIKLGRMEPDEKPIVQEIGPDGKVIIPSLSYVDIGGMGENANKSFWTNIPNSNSFISFDLVLSSYQGEKLTNYLTDYDVDFRKIVYEEINKKELKQFDGSQGKKQLLEDIKNEFNAYLANKELDPVIFGAYFKVFAITTRG